MLDLNLFETFKYAVVVGAGFWIGNSAVKLILTVPFAIFCTILHLKPKDDSETLKEIASAIRELKK
jgi:high-affinity nickel permease